MKYLEHYYIIYQPRGAVIHSYYEGWSRGIPAGIFFLRLLSAT